MVEVIKLQYSLEDGHPNDMPKGSMIVSTSPRIDFHFVSATVTSLGHTESIPLEKVLKFKFIQCCTFQALLFRSLFRGGLSHDPRKVKYSYRKKEYEFVVRFISSYHARRNKDGGVMYYNFWPSYY